MLEALLRVRDASGNQISGVVPSPLHLLAIVLPRNRISGVLPDDPEQMSTPCVIQLDFNRHSGTLPSMLGTKLTLVMTTVSSNRFSGTIATEIVNLEFLRTLNVGYNALSGTIPSAPTVLTTLRHMLAGSNRLSGSLPAELSKLTALDVLELGRNALSGSSSAAFSNWPALTQLLIFENPQLQFDLNLLSTWPRLEGALMQGCNIYGILPSSAMPNLKVLLLNRNSVSGTIASALVGASSKLQTIDLSQTRISGTISNSMAHMSSLKAALLNSLKLSGTLPKLQPSSHHRAASTSERSMYEGLETLSMCRNYISGDTSVLEDSSNLSTIILSSNYLSCNAPSLDGAESLAQGGFEDPGISAMKSIGVSLESVTSQDMRNANDVFCNNASTTATLCQLGFKELFSALKDGTIPESINLKLPGVILTLSLRAPESCCIVQSVFEHHPQGVSKCSTCFQWQPRNDSSRFFASTC